MMTPLRSVSRDAKALRAHAWTRRALHWRSTPNPLARELVLAPGKLLLPHDDAVLRLQKQPVFEVAQAFEAALSNASPLVGKLVGVEDVDEVLLGADRVTVKICDLHGSWDDVGPRVKEIVREALRCGPMPASALAELHELLGAEATGAGGPAAAWPAGSVEAEIVDVLEAHIRPYVREDGGDLRFVGFDDARGTARVQLVGACSGCPSSAATLHGRVEKLLKHMVAEVRAVEAVTDAEVAAERGAGGGAAAEAAAAPEKVSLEEHIRRMLAEGAETSVVWNSSVGSVGDAHRG